MAQLKGDSSRLSVVWVASRASLESCAEFPYFVRRADEALKASANTIMVTDDAPFAERLFNVRNIAIPVVSSARRLPPDLIAALAVTGPSSAVVDRFRLDPRLAQQEPRRLLAGILSWIEQLHTNSHANEAADAASIYDYFRVARRLKLTGGPPVVYPENIAISESGMIAIADRYDYNVKLYDSDGSHLTTLSGRGTSGSEIRGPHWTGFLDSSRIVVLDDGAMEYGVFSLAGQELERHPVSLRPLGGFGVTVDKHLAIAGIGPVTGLRDYSEFRSVHVVGEGDSLRGSYVDLPIGLEQVVELRGLAIPRIAVDEDGRLALVSWNAANAVAVVDLESGAVVADTALALPGLAQLDELVRMHADGAWRESGSKPSSFLVSLAWSNGVVVVGYIEPALGSADAGKLRYALLDRRLRILGHGMTGPLVYHTQRGGPVAIHLRGRGPDREAELEFLAPRQPD